MQVTPWACACAYIHPTFVRPSSPSSSILCELPFCLSCTHVYACGMCLNFLPMANHFQRPLSYWTELLLFVWSSLFGESFIHCSFRIANIWVCPQKKHTVVYFVWAGKKKYIYVLRWQWHINGCYFAEFFLYQSLTQLKCSLLKFCVIFLFSKINTKKNTIRDRKHKLNRKTKKISEQKDATLFSGAVSHIQFRRRSHYLRNKQDIRMEHPSGKENPTADNIVFFYDRLIKHDLQVSNTPSVLYPSAAQPSHFLTHTCFFFVCASIRHTELVVLMQEMIKVCWKTLWFHQMVRWTWSRWTWQWGRRHTQMIVLFPYRADPLAGRQLPFASVQLSSRDRICELRHL